MTDTASQYEAKFSGTHKWEAEFAAVAELLGDMPRGSTVLDCPVGTGRFLPLYGARGLFCFGADISPEMIRAARRRCSSPGTPFRLEIRDLLELSYQTDVAVCVRFLGDWLAPRKFDQALAVLRGCAPMIICGLRYGGRDEPGKYWSIARERFEEAMLPYRIERAIPLDEQDYWMNLCCR